MNKKHKYSPTRIYNIIADTYDRGEDINIEALSSVSGWAPESIKLVLQLELYRGDDNDYAESEEVFHVDNSHLDAAGKSLDGTDPVYLDDDDQVDAYHNEDPDELRFD